MKTRILSPALITKDLVKEKQGKSIFDYEAWAIELINHSSAFMKRTHDKSFVTPCSEAHGESDAMTKDYCIDFKLILGQSMQRAIRECSQERTTFNGITLLHPSRSNSDMCGVRLHAALRKRNLEQLRNLMSISHREKCHDDAEKDVWSFLKSIDHPKNLLLIYPCLFYSSDDSSIAYESVNLALCYDFRNAMQLRTQRHPEYETFLAYFLEDSMIILQVREDKLSTFDSVPVYMSPTFMNILRLCDESKYVQLFKKASQRRYV